MRDPESLKLTEWATTEGAAVDPETLGIDQALGYDQRYQEMGLMRYPERTGFNWLIRVLSAILIQQLGHGVPPYNALIPYRANAWCQYEGNLYRSLRATRGSRPDREVDWRRIYSLLAMAAIPDISVASGGALSATLPVATQGSGRYTYALTGAPSWVRRSGRSLSGTAPHQSARTVRLTWRATDNETGRTVSRTFDIATTLRSGLGSPAPTATATSTDTLRIAWAAIANASSTATTYRIRHKLASATNYGAWSSATSPHDIGSLSSNTEYDVQVEASAPGYVASVGTVRRRTLSGLSMAAVANQALDAGDALALTLPVATRGSGRYTYALTGAPSWVSLDASTRRISGTAPYPSAATSDTLTWTATDSSSGLRVSRSFRITVATAPISLSAVGDRAYRGGSRLRTVLPQATGGSGTYTYAISGNPSWTSLSGFTLSGTAPYQVTSSTHEITWTATDTESGLTAEITFDVIVERSAGPTLAGVSDVTLDPNDLLNVTLPQATGGSGNYSYVLSGEATWMRRRNFHLGGSAPWPAADTTTTVTWTVTDTSSLQTAEITFDVTVEAQAPVLGSITSRAFRSGSSLDLTLADPTSGSGNYSFAITGAPSWVTVTGKRLTGTVPYQSSRSSTITVVVTDTDSTLTATRTFRLSTQLRTDLGTPSVTEVVASRTLTQIRVSWAAIANNSGTATTYRIRHKLASATNYGAWAAATSPEDITGLTRATAYDIQVEASAPGYSSKVGTVQLSTEHFTIDFAPVLYFDNLPAAQSGQYFLDPGWERPASLPATASWVVEFEVRRVSSSGVFPLPSSVDWDTAETKEVTATTRGDSRGRLFLKRIGSSTRRRYLFSARFTTDLAGISPGPVAQRLANQVPN